jgi:hypothetical protein
VSVLFYISGHGFGHASRQVEIINALAASRPGTRIVVRTGVSRALLRRTLKAPVDLRPGDCDPGIVQATSLDHDDGATLEAAVRFYEQFDARAAREAAALGTENVRLIVADIPPLAFDVAWRLGVPSAAVANFTWDWIYETHPGFDTVPWLLATIREAYRRATVAFELPFAAGFDVFPRVERLPLVARRPTRARAETRVHFGIAQDRPAALLSFGGYGLPDLDLSRVDCLEHWTIVTSDRTRAGGTGAGADRVLTIPEEALLQGWRYEDLVAAVDVVITKPGYGIIAECLATGTAMLYTSRGQFREYNLLVSQFPRFVRSLFISQENLFAGRWRESLEAARRLPPPAERMPTNGAEVAATRLSALLDE